MSVYRWQQPDIASVEDQVAGSGGSGGGGGEVDGGWGWWKPLWRLFPSPLYGIPVHSSNSIVTVTGYKLKLK